MHVAISQNSLENVLFYTDKFNFVQGELNVHKTEYARAHNKLSVGDDRFLVPLCNGFKDAKHHNKCTCANHCPFQNGLCQNLLFQKFVDLRGENPKHCDDSTKDCGDEHFAQKHHIGEFGFCHDSFAFSKCPFKHFHSYISLIFFSF